MTSEEYVNQVNRLMDLQTTYLNIFLWFLGIVIAIILALQWWLNNKQMEQIKVLTKQEVIKEIEESLGVSSIEEFKNDVKKQVTNLKYDMHNQVGDIVKERDRTDAARLYYELIPLQYEETFLWRIPLIIDAYNTYISDNIRNFNSFVSDISGLITVTQNEGKLNEGVNSPHIDIIIDRLTEIEKGFNEKSNQLEHLNKLIKMYKRFEK
ncbi:hypothetical protein ACRCJ1_00100 [Aerococcus sp. L_4]